MKELTRTFGLILATGMLTAAFLWFVSQLEQDELNWLPEPSDELMDFK